MASIVLNKATGSSSPSSSSPSLLPGSTTSIGFKIDHQYYFQQQQQQQQESPLANHNTSSYPTNPNPTGYNHYNQPAHVDPQQNPQMCNNPNSEIENCCNNLKFYSNYDQSGDHMITIGKKIYQRKQRFSSFV
jgi:hypothetical protein